jgi:hypothetical protein
MISQRSNSVVLIDGQLTKLNQLGRKSSTCRQVSLPPSPSLSAIGVFKYYAKHWKVEHTIKDLKQRLGFGDYQVRNLQAISRQLAFHARRHILVERMAVTMKTMKIRIKKNILDNYLEQVIGFLGWKGSHRCTLTKLVFQIL